MESRSGINYRRTDGEGKPLVFVHGWLGSRKSWKLVEGHLNLENPKIFLDQRCHGSSPCRKFSIRDLAEDLKEVVDESCDEDPIIVGHSMGGMTALQYAAMHDGYESLCLLGTCASTPEPEIESPRFFLEKLNEMDRKEWARMITKNYLGNTGEKELKKATELELRDAEKKPIIYGLEAMIEYDIRDQLSSETHAIVVAGENDGAITLEKSREVAELLNADTVIIDSGHLMLHERPKRIAQIIEKFVQDL